VKEEHHPPSNGAPDHTAVVNKIVSVNLESGDEAVIAQGRDFFATPRLRGDGGALAWVQWDHVRCAVCYFNF
jgi:hypothetical protein